MNAFENELRSALQRVEPSRGFTGRVMAHATPPRRTGRLAAAIAACVLLSVGGFEYRQYRGRKAKQELLVALDIASGKLNIAQKKVIDLSRRTIHD